MNITPEHIRALDTAKFSLYESKEDGAFLGTLMCNMGINWDSNIPTAQTNGLSMEINPDWFLKLPEATRSTVLQHELWHIGHLHMLRGQGLDHWKFNKAADYAINLQLQDDGCSFIGTTPLLDTKFRGMSAEEIYDVLPDDSGSSGQGQVGCWSDNPDDRDLGESSTDAEASEIVSIVQSAVIAQQRTGYSSQEVEAISERIKKHNKPKVGWKVELREFCKEKARAGLDYNRRNRRYRSVILPARGKRGRLTELAFFMDISGSVTTAMAEQMMSELCSIWDLMKPKKLHIIQFDTRIRYIETWHTGRSPTEIDIHGRGGTSLEPVAQWLEKNPVNGAVIMTDLDCPIMRVVKGAPILWLCINDPTATVQQGKLIHIEV